METRQCRECGEEKLLIDFYYRKDSETYRTECKECKRVKDRIYWLKNRENNKEKRKNYAKGYYQKNKERLLKCHKEYNDNNKEKISEQKIEYGKKNKERILKYGKEYRKKNKEKISEQRKEYFKVYCKNNREKINANNNKHYKENFKFRLNRCVRSSVRDSLKLNNISKNGRHWEDLVGYTSQELIDYLEKLFLPGMTWDNYEEWHLDHILPQSFFEYNSTDDVEFKYCWSLDNLQPLWAKDNIRKSDKIIKGGI